MRVIVCGAGLVGSSIAGFLAAEGVKVTVIEHDPKVAARIADTLDVQAVVGHAALPDVLNDADAANADMIIAVTQSDEVNMIACEVADCLFDVPNKIARIRHQSFLKNEWANLFSRDNLAIDTIISPEVEIARAIARRLHVPGCFDTKLVANNKVRLIGVAVGKEAPALNTPLRQLIKLFPELTAVIVGIIRNDRAFMPNIDDMLLEGDGIYLLCDAEHTARVMAVLGHTEPEARQVVIVGGGNVGLYLSQLIENEFSGVSLRIIERNRERAEYIAEQLKGTIVLNADALDLEILEEAKIADTETIVCITNDDETNILTSLLAKRHGCQRSITLVNKPTYAPLLNNLGLNAVVNPRLITVSSVMQLVRRGRIRAVHHLRDGFADMIEAEALEGSPVVNIPLRDLRLPYGVVIGAVVHEGQVIRPWPDTVIRAHDRVILLSNREHIRKVEQLFSIRPEYF